MGKLFDSLKQGQAKRNPLAPHTGVPPQHPLQAVWPEEGDADLATGEDVPFVEVGGPRSAAPAPLAPGGRGVGAEGVGPSVAIGVTLPVAESRFISVRFQPVPVLPAGRRGAPQLSPEIVAYHQPDHAISAQYRAVASALLMNVQSDDARLLLFSGADAGCGTTTVVLNTAVTLARLYGRRVIVVDAHVRRNAIAARFDIEEPPGLREVLGGFVPLEAAVRATAVPRLDVLTAGSPDTCSASRLASELMRQALRTLRDRCDVVLVDGPCWDGRPEVVALGTACDAVYLCLPESAHSAPATADLIQVIAEQGAALRGCLLTSR